MEDHTTINPLLSRRDNYGTTSWIFIYDSVYIAVTSQEQVPFAVGQTWLTSLTQCSHLSATEWSNHLLQRHASKVQICIQCANNSTDRSYFLVPSWIAKTIGSKVLCNTNKHLKDQRALKVERPKDLCGLCMCYGPALCVYTCCVSQC